MRTIVFLIRLHWNLVAVSLVALSFVVACDKTHRDEKNSGVGIETKKRNNSTISSNQKKFRKLRRDIADSSNSIEQIATKDALLSQELKKLSTEGLLQLFSTLDLANDGSDKGLIAKILYALAESDPKSALDAACTLPEDNSTLVMNLLYSRMVATNPAAVTEWVLDSDLEQAGVFKLVTKCAFELASNAPDDAADLLARCDKRTRKYVGGNILGAIGKTDPQRALKIIERFPPDERAEAYASALRGASVTDGGMAFEMLGKLGDAAVSPKVYGSLFLSWIEQDPRAAGDALATIPPSSIQSVLENPSNLSALITRDPGMAMKALDQMIHTEANSNIFAQAAREIAGKDPAAAMAWLGSFQDSPKKGGLVREIATSRAAADPGTNVPLILNEQSPYRVEAIEGAGTAWGRVDAGKALQYVAALPVEEQKLYAMAVLRASSQTNPGAMVECISNNSLPPAVRDSNEYKGMVTSTASSFAARDLQEAVKWANSLPGGASEAAVSGVASHWASKDPGATGAWIGKMPAGPARNAAIQALVGQIERTDPDAARQWKASITK